MLKEYRGRSGTCPTTLNLCQCDAQFAKSRLHGAVRQGQVEIANGARHFRVRTGGQTSRMSGDRSGESLVLVRMFSDVLVRIDLQVQF